MARTFNHLSYEQRVQIKKMLDAGIKKGEIAQALGVHNATVYREIIRGTIDGVYDPGLAEDQYRGHLSDKGPQAICAISPALSERIADLILKEKLSPGRIIEVLQGEEEKWGTIPKAKTTIYKAIDDGLIPDVTRESLNSYITTMFGGGQLHIAKWVRDELNISDGDELTFKVIDGKLVFTKVAE